MYSHFQRSIWLKIGIMHSFWHLLYTIYATSEWIIFLIKYWLRIKYIIHDATNWWYIIIFLFFLSTHRRKQFYISDSAASSIFVSDILRVEAPKTYTYLKFSISRYLVMWWYYYLALFSIEYRAQCRWNGGNWCCNAFVMLVLVTIQWLFLR